MTVPYFVNVVVDDVLAADDVMNVLGGKMWDYPPTGGINVYGDSGTPIIDTAFNAQYPISKKKGLSAYAANKRWETETVWHSTQYVTVNSHPLKTDANSQRKIAILDLNYRIGVQTGTTEFKLADGTFITVGAIEISYFNNGISLYIKNCYDVEQSTNVAITSGAITTKAQIDDAFAAISRTFTYP